MITTQDLKVITSFKNLDDGAIALAASRSADMRLVADEWLINEGEVPRFFCVISGALEVSKRVGGTPTVITTYRTGDSFGEVPLMLGSTAVSSVRATEASHLAALDPTDFWRLMHAHENFAKAVSADMSARIAGLWSTALEAPTARCAIVGDPNSPDCHRLRDFLTRLHVPFDWEERGGPRCDVTFADGRRLVSPTIRELAQALDLRTSPRTHCYDVAIVGAGPAGLAAAVYGASEGLRTILVERDAPGGQAGMSSRIENYLGFPNGISGEDLADRAYRQVNRFGADVVVTREAIRIEGPLYDRRIVLDGEETIHCRSAVLATGVSYRYLTARGCDDFLNRGVYYGAAQAEARHVAGRRIHLLGGGNSAGQAAMFFSSYAAHVSIVIRKDDLSATMSQYLIDELHKQPNVSVIANGEIVAVEGNVELEALILRSVIDGTQRREPSDALFVFIGADAHTEWLRGFVATDEQGFVLTGRAITSSKQKWPLSREPFLLETDQVGIFAVGDVRKSSVKRVASGVGEGSTAISMVHQILAEMPPSPEREPSASGAAAYATTAPSL
jgi:thioredoxin reductase (NADPH)